MYSGMGLGSTAKKLQKVVDMAEDLYTRINDLREQVVEVRETVDETKSRVDSLEVENAEQRALLEALAAEQGIDVESVTADAHIRDAEKEATSGNGDAEASAGGSEASRSDDAPSAGSDA
jgi:peptidoglycan hydrolase CwlO-like protein